MGRPRDFDHELIISSRPYSQPIAHAKNATKNVGLGELKAQSWLGRPFLAIFSEFCPENAFFALFLTQDPNRTAELVVFHQTLDILTHSTYVVDVLTLVLASFRPKIAIFSHFQAF